MKKWISGLIVGVMLASTTVVGAASQNITVQHTPQVKFTFNGTEKALPEGYTVLMHQDRTYVPARFIADNMGGTVDWDNATETVIINSFSNGVSVRNIKTFSNIAHHYHMLETLSERLIDAPNSFGLALDEFDLYGTKDHMENGLRQRISGLENHIQVTSTAIDALINQASSQGVNLSDMRTIINAQKESLRYYQESYKGLQDYYYSKTESDFDRYLENNKSGFGIAMSTVEQATRGYNDYVGKIQQQ